MRNLLVPSIIPFIFIVLLLNSCKKEDKIQVRVMGSVEDYYTQENIVKDGLYLVSTIIDPTNPQLRQDDPYSSTTILKKISIDSKGSFDEEVDVINSSNLHYLVYYNETNISATYLLKLESSNNTTVYVKPFRNLIISIEDTSNNYDSHSLSVKTGPKLYNQFSLKGDIDETILTKVIPDEDCQIRFMKINSDRNYEYTDTTIYIENIDESFYEILY